MTTPIIESNETLFIQQSLSASPQIKKKPIPPYLELCHAKNKLLFLEIYKRGIVDQFGNLTSQFKGVNLPSFTEAEKKLIEKFLFQEFTLVFPDNTQKIISLKEMLNHFTQHGFNDNTLASLENELVGSLVVYLLFKYLSDYPRRLFRVLKCEDLYIEYKDLFAGYSLPHDGDIRILLTPHKHLSRKAFSDVTNYLPQAVGKTRETSGFDYRSCSIGHVDLSIVELVNMKREDGLHFELILCQSLPTNGKSVFHLDALFLPLCSFMFQGINTEAHPASRCELSLQPVVDHLLGHIKAIDLFGIDSLGFLRLTSWKIKGKVPAQEKLEKQLLHAFLSATKKVDKAIANWSNTHLEGDDIGTLFFTLQAYYTLWPHLDDPKIVFNGIKNTPNLPPILNLLAHGLRSKQSDHKMVADYIECHISHSLGKGVPLDGVTLYQDSDVMSHLFYRLTYTDCNKTYTLQIPIDSKKPHAFTNVGLTEIQQILIQQFPSILPQFPKHLQRELIGLMEQVMGVENGAFRPLLRKKNQNLTVFWFTLLLQKGELNNSLFLFVARYMDTHQDDFKHHPDLVIATAETLITIDLFHLAKSLLKSPHLPKSKCKGAWIAYYHKKLKAGKSASCIHLHLKSMEITPTLKDYKPFLDDLCQGLQKEGGLGALMELEKKKSLSLDDLYSYKYAVAQLYFEKDPTLGIDALRSLINEQGIQDKRFTSLFCKYFRKLLILDPEKSHDLFVFASSSLPGELLINLCIEWFSTEKNPQTRHYKTLCLLICNVTPNHEITSLFLNHLKKHTAPFEKSGLFPIKKEVQKALCSIVDSLAKDPSVEISTRLLTLIQTCRLSLPKTESYALFWANGLLNADFTELQVALLIIAAHQFGFFHHKTAQHLYLQILYPLFEKSIKQKQYARAFIYMEWLLTFDPQILREQSQLFLLFQAFLLESSSTHFFPKSIELLLRCFTVFSKIKTLFDTTLVAAFSIARMHHPPSVYFPKLLECYLPLQNLSPPSQTVFGSVIRMMITDHFNMLQQKERYNENEVALYLFYFLQHFTVHCAEYSTENWIHLVGSLKNKHPEKLYECGKLLDFNFNVFDDSQEARRKFWIQIIRFFSAYKNSTSLKLFNDKKIWELVDQSVGEEYVFIVAPLVEGALENLDQITCLNEKKRVLLKCYKVIQTFNHLERQWRGKILPPDTIMEIDADNLSGLLNNGHFLFSCEQVKNIQSIADFQNKVNTCDILYLNKREAIIFGAISQIEITWLIKAFECKCLINQAKAYASLLAAKPFSSTTWFYDVPRLSTFLAQYDLYKELLSLLSAYSSFLLPTMVKLVDVGRYILNAGKRDPEAIFLLVRIWYHALNGGTIEINSEGCSFAISILKSVLILDREKYQYIISNVFHLTLEKFDQFRASPRFFHLFFNIRLQILPRIIFSQHRDKAIAEFKKLTKDVHKLRKNRSNYYEKMIDCVVAFSNLQLDAPNYLGLAILSYRGMFKHKSTTSYQLRLQLVKNVLLNLSPLQSNAFVILNVVAAELTAIANDFPHKHSKKRRLELDALFSLIIWKGGFLMSSIRVNRLIQIKINCVNKGKMSLPKYYKCSRHEKQVRQSQIKIGRLLDSGTEEGVKKAILQASSDELFYLKETPEYFNYVHTYLATFISNQFAEKKKLELYAYLDKLMGSTVTEKMMEDPDVADKVIISKTILIKFLLSECSWEKPSACVSDGIIQQSLILTLSILENCLERKTFRLDPNTYINLLSKVSRSTSVLLRLKRYKKYQDRFSIPNMASRFITGLGINSSQEILHFNLTLSLLTDGWKISWQTPFDQFGAGNNAQPLEELLSRLELTVLGSGTEET